MLHRLLTAGLVAALALSAAPRPHIRALIVVGQNNHKDWPETTPLLESYLEETGLFSAVDVVTTPPEGQDMSTFAPKFSDYDVVVSNYAGDPWPEKTRIAFEQFVAKGGGFVSIHAADNAFPDWPEYNQMIGVGGWGYMGANKLFRDQASGPYLRLRDGKWVRDAKTPGPGGHHGERHEFKIVVRDADHPIVKGLPKAWMHVEDELYDQLRGPAKNVDVIASAYSDPSTRGTGEDEPILMAIPYGKGRVFHTTLGHNALAMRGVGFIVTFQRGTEWAATGKVTQPAPEKFPTEDHTLSR